MNTNAPAVEYLATSRLGEKGQLTVPKEYRDELGLGAGAPVSLVRVGDGLVLIPELSRFHRLCDSIAKVLESHGATLAQLQASLPRARKRVFARRYPRLVRKSSGKAKGRVRQA
jgi:AbrB family looped-hinge helix DNA binding protein